MLQGGVDLRHVRWAPFDGVGREVRNGLNFTERGFGVRGAVGCSDRGHTAASQLRPGDVDWDDVFGAEGARWFHCGGIFAARSGNRRRWSPPRPWRRLAGTAPSSPTTSTTDRRLWKSIGGQARAREVNQRLAPLVDVMLGNEEDFSAALGFEVEGVDADLTRLDPRALRRHDEAGRRAPIPACASWRRRCAPCQRDMQRLECRRAGPDRAPRGVPPIGPVSRSSTASAAATASRPVSSSACSKAWTCSWRSSTAPRTAPLR